MAKFINVEGIAIKDTRKTTRVRLIGAQDCYFKSRVGIAYPANHCNQMCWNFVSDEGDQAIVEDLDIEFLE